MLVFFFLFFYIFYMDRTLNMMYEWIDASSLYHYNDTCI